VAAGLILFAHGSRDPGWAEPLEKLAARVRGVAPAHEVRTAFLEIMPPNLREAVGSLAAKGIRSVRVVPIFFGQGGHMRRDLPTLIEELRAAHPGMSIESVQPAGEDDGVLEAIVAYCVRQLSSESR